MVSVTICLARFVPDEVYFNQPTEKRTKKPKKECEEVHRMMSRVV